MKYVLWVVAAVLILGGGWYVVSQNQSAPANHTGDRIKEPTISWQFTDGGEQSGIPRTKVTVTINGVAHEVGAYQGSCSQVGATGGIDGKGLLAGELSAAQCWYAGGGDEIGVFAVEDGTIEVMVGSLGEPVDGGEGFRGDFKIREDITL